MTSLIVEGALIHAKSKGGAGVCVPVNRHLLSYCSSTYYEHLTRLFHFFLHSPDPFLPDPAPPLSLRMRVGNIKKGETSPVLQIKLQIVHTFILNKAR